MKYLAALVFGVLTTFSVAWASPEASDIFKLINERLSYMEDVALFKKQTGKPVEDIPRENVVVEKASLKARDEGLDPESVVGFFRAQIDAAKAIQYRYLADWLSRSVDREPRDLNTVVRPALLKLGNEITIEISNYLKSGHQFTDSQWQDFLNQVNVSNLSEADKRRLFDKLREIRRIQ
ncbi:chorismate mutase [Endozoicomonas arenosclerae]|uniref:chorismate mutase n=1 Tax=Endozoicomonas arenosclerae TaxID=1633495 RepID=UPI000783FBCD|nr:chorismate mutase [Endozoicomonas arenosclerae]